MFPVYHRFEYPNRSRHQLIPSFCFVFRSFHRRVQENRQCASSSDWGIFIPFWSLPTPSDTWMYYSSLELQRKETRNARFYVSHDHSSTATVAAYTTGMRNHHMRRSNDSSNDHSWVHLWHRTATRQRAATIATTKLTSHWASEKPDSCTIEHPSSSPIQHTTLSTRKRASLLKNTRIS